jgi:hypothetical protein
LKSAIEIVDSIGMSFRPEYFSGRGATTTDLNGEMLFKIYNSIKKENGERAAEAYVEMVKSIKTLSATNFLNSLYLLEACKWVYKKSDFESDSDLGPDCDGRIGVAFATIANTLSNGDRDDTFFIRNSFMHKIGQPSEKPKSPWLYADDNYY